ncbi:hypothetical protein [Enteractinococcus helveticum]|uniref:hypothetical protein n=1 Tax=Enteractinococcus helveticum TaxID=1837282 RepID=UPI000A62C86A|nr:hypothetical protein [Enteractinococcus helveticum]
MTNRKPKSELDKWKQAVKDSLKTIKWLERRGDEKTERIRVLEYQIKELGDTP